MEQRLIDPTGATCLLALTFIAKLLTPEPRMLAVRVGSGGWFIAFVSGVIALGGYWFLARLLRRFPVTSLTGINRALFGPVGGALLTVPYLFYFIFLAGIALREFVVGFRLAVMPHTPASALALVYILVVAFIAVKGMETLSRITAYLYPTLVLLFAFTLVGPIRFLDYRGLFPVLGLRANETLWLSLPETSLYSEVIILGVLAAMLKPGKVVGVGLKAVISGIIGQTAGWMLFLAAFPHPMISRLSFPMLEVVRLIEVSEIIQRLEAFFVFLWFFVAALKLSLLLLCASLTITEMLDLKDYRPLMAPVLSLVYSISFIPPNDVALVWLDSFTLRVWSWPISFAMPALTLLWAVVSGKRGESPGAPGNFAG